MWALKDITGQRFGKLVALRIAGRDRQAEVTWECICDCGGVSTVNGSQLRRGKIKSCGCTRVSHRMTNSRPYRVWRSMLQRCNNPKNPNYHNYGGRGIKVCQEWQKFELFWDWAKANGYAENLELDREDNDAGYAPGNCRFVTHAANTRNTRRSRPIMFGGEKITISELSRETGIHESTLHRRIVKMGMTAEQAIELPRDTWKTRRLRPQ